MSKKSANTAALIDKVLKGKEKLKNLRKPPEERDQPVRPTQVHKKKTNYDRKENKAIARKAARDEY